MQQPPQTNRRRKNQQSPHLVTPEDARLLRARSLLGLLFVVRLDACVDHPLLATERAQLLRASRLSIGANASLRLNVPIGSWP
jgi:hypothetical protein